MADRDTQLLINELKDRLGISQEELAKRRGVAFATVNRWLNGKSVPRGKSMASIMELVEKEGLDLKDDATGGRRGKNGVLGTKSMEQMLWSAACSIRGEKDAPKFKDYILPLVFVKRLSDVFEDEVERLSETYGSKEEALDIIETARDIVRFYIPPEARWPVVSGK